MPVIAPTAPTAGAVAVTETTLTSGDTLTFNPQRLQLLQLRNPTGSLVGAIIDGDGGTTVRVPGIGAVDVSGGLTISVPAGETRAVVLASISAYCQGNVAVSGAGLRASLIEL